MTLAEVTLGARVRVVELIDEIGDPRYIGHTGTVTSIDVDGHDIGESAERPFIVVTFDRPVWLRSRVAAVEDGEVETLPGFSVHERDGFWPEEIEPWL